MFRFSLQRVLDYKRQIRETIENEITIIQGRIETTRRNLSETQNEVDSHMTALREYSKGERVEVTELSIRSAYIDSMRAQAKMLEGQMRRLNEKLEKKRVELVAASQEEKVMEKLRERELKAFNEAAQKAENAFLDEIAVRRYVNAKAE